jgi:hypothetical protein
MSLGLKEVTEVSDVTELPTTDATGTEATTTVEAVSEADEDVVAELDRWSFGGLACRDGSDD